MSLPGLSIVVPAHNEEASVASTVSEVAAVARQLECDYEILVVNDGSTDCTAAIVRELARDIWHLRLVEHYPNRGYGGALKAGFAAASKELIALVPADGQFVFGEIDRFLDKIAEADIVCGYRARRQDSLLRNLNGWVWNVLVRLLFGYLCRDVDCGFKLLRRGVVEQVPLNSNGAMIDAELLAGARARGFRIVEVPVTHRPRAGGVATGAKPGVILKAFGDLLSFRFRLSREMSRGRGRPRRRTVSSP